MNKIFAYLLLLFSLFTEPIFLYDKGAVFGWGRVNFLLSGWWGGMFWICVNTHNKYTGLITGDGFVAAEQGVHRAKALPVLCTGGKLGGDTAETADPSDQRDTPGHHAQCVKWGKKEERGGLLEWVVFCLPKSLLHSWVPAFPAHGKK